MKASEKINAILSHLDVNAKVFATSLGYDRPQLIYDIQKGKTKSISEGLANKIISVYSDINKVWLLTGEGEMLKGGISQTATEQSAVNGNINVNGNVHESNLTTTSEKFLDLLQAKEQCLATAQENLATTQEQVNRLISIIEKMQNNH